ncbi:MAG: hypothetical protein WEA80_05965 [Gemmatimonadaceae bacterium]
MYRALKVIVSCGAVLVAGCGDSSRMTAELQKDLALASADADLQLASRATDQTRIVGPVERTTLPARAVAKSTRAPRPRRSPAPQIVADVQPETEFVEESEVAAVEEPMPYPEPVVEAPVEIAASTRPRAIEPAVGGTGSRGTDWGTIIGIAGTVVLRGGDVGEDRCIPPGAGRGRTPIAINERFPPRTRGTGRVTMGSGSGRMGGRPVMRSAPSRPRDVATRPTSSPSSRIRPMPSGGTSGTSSNVREGRTAANGDFQ